MGQGGLILLVNKTPYIWNKTHKHSYEMSAWDSEFPQSLRPGDQAKVYVEWKSGSHDNDSAGETRYELEGTGKSFEVRARGRVRPEEPGSQEGLAIFFKDFATGQHKQGDWLNLGWQHDGSVGFLLAGNVHSFNSSAMTSNAKWMSLVDGARKLNELTIPGTHDSGTYRFNDGIMHSPSDDPIETLILGSPSLASILGAAIMALPGALLFDWAADTIAQNITQCQDWDFAEQLKRGIRFLDIRLKLGTGDELRLYHAGMPLVLPFKKVLKTCYDFLDQNPGETIIMSVKNEAGGQNNTFDSKLNEFIQEKPGSWYTSVQIPKLEEVRKKIVLFRRFAATPGRKLGIDASYWPDNEAFKHPSDDGLHFDIQDRYESYKLGGQDHKFYDYLLPCLRRANENVTAGTVFVNFTSGTGGVYPRTLATGYMSQFAGTNKLLSDWLNGHKGTARLGCIPMDFPGYPSNGVMPSQLVYRNDFNRYETALAPDCWYEIHPAQASGSCLHVKGNLKQPETPIVLCHTTGGPNTRWKPETAGSDYILRPQSAPDMVLDVKGAKTINQTPTILFGFKNRDNDNQKWMIEPISPNSQFFTLKPRHAPQKALELFGVDTADDTPATLYDANNTVAQRWSFLMVGFAPGRLYSLSPRAASRSSLTLYNTPHQGPGVSPEIWPDVGALEGKLWKLVPAPGGDDWFYIEAQRDPAQVLGVEGSANKTPAGLYAKSGSDNQKWRIESCGNGYFVLIPKHAPTRVLELYNANTANGTKPSLYDANGSIAQQWILRPNRP